MKAFREFINQPLEWAPTNPNVTGYALKAGDETVITLTVSKEDGGTPMLAQIGDEQWLFKRAQFLQPQASIRRPNSETDYALYTLDKKRYVCAQIYREWQGVYLELL